MKKNYKYCHDIIHKSLKVYKLKENEKQYIINKITNAVRQCGDIYCIDNFRFCDLSDSMSGVFVPLDIHEATMTTAFINSESKNE